jgi:hypothetical protein
MGERRRQELCSSHNVHASTLILFKPEACEPGVVALACKPSTPKPQAGESRI